MFWSLKVSLGNRTNARACLKGCWGDSNEVTGRKGLGLWAIYTVERDRGRGEIDRETDHRKRARTSLLTPLSELP